MQSARGAQFRPNWRVELEQKLFAEIIISNAAAYVAGGVLDSGGIDEMARFFTTDPRVGDCIGYSSNARLREDILEYAEIHTQSSIMRTETRQGPSHHRLDYPESDQKNWQGKVVVANKKNGKPNYTIKKLEEEA